MLLEAADAGNNRAPITSWKFDVEEPARFSMKTLGVRTSTNVEYVGIKLGAKQLLPPLPML